MGRELDMAAEIGEAADEAVDGFGLVALVEVKRTEVAVVDAVAEHVVGGGEHGGRDGEGRLLGATAGFEAEKLGTEIAVALASGGPGGGDEGSFEPVRALAYTGGASFAGALIVAWAEACPRHEMAGRGEAMSTPISATMTCATMSLTPGIVVRRAARCWIGASNFPAAASISSSADSRAAIRPRWSLSMAR